MTGHRAAAPRAHRVSREGGKTRGNRTVVRFWANDRFPVRRDRIPSVPGRYPASMTDCSPHPHDDPRYDVRRSDASSGASSSTRSSTRWRATVAERAPSRAATGTTGGPAATPASAAARPVRLRHQFDAGCGCQLLGVGERRRDRGGARHQPRHGARGGCATAAAVAPGPCVPRRAAAHGRALLHQLRGHRLRARCPRPAAA